MMNKNFFWGCCVLEILLMGIIGCSSENEEMVISRSSENSEKEKISKVEEIQKTKKEEVEKKREREEKKVYRAGDEYLGVKEENAAIDNTSQIPTRVTVQESKIVRKVPKELLGFNHNWLWSERYTIDHDTKTISKEFLELFKGFPMNMARMSGTLSQEMRWKWAVGPLEKRKVQKLAGHDTAGAKVLGPLEWVDSVLKIDPQSKIVWSLNLDDDSPQDHADLARLFTAGKEDPWGKMRIEYGMKEPVPIKIWELANELDWGEHRERFPISTYITACKNAIKAIKEVMPEAKFAAHASTAPWSPVHKKENKEWYEWHQAVLRELGDEIDYITLHPYYHGKAPASLMPFLDQIRDDIIRITKSDNIKIYLSEHAVWPSSPKDKNAWRFANKHETHAVKGCLGTAEFLNLIYYRPEVTAGGYHCLSGGIWGLYFRGEETQKLYKTGIYDLFLILNEGIGGGELVQVDVNGKRTNQNSTNLTFTASGFVSEEGLNLILVNREKTAVRPTTFSFLEEYSLLESVQLTGENFDSHNTEHQQGVFVSRKKEEQPNFTQYDVPPRSVVVLKLKSKN